MALHAKNLSFLFLLLLSTSLHIEARQSKFFTKPNHIHKSIKTTKQIESSSPSPSPSPSPSLAPTPELAPTPAEVEYGYGLYGYDSNLDTSSNNAKNGNGDVYDDRLYADANNNEESSNGDSYGYNGNLYAGSNNNNNDDRVYADANNEENSNGDSYGYNGNLYAASNNNNNGYVSEGQLGLSDTKFLENGENYYDVKNENYFQNGYEPVRGSDNNDEGYYGNNVDAKYEFNTMEEYERQEEYANSHRDEYIP